MREELWTHLSDSMYMKDLGEVSCALRKNMKWDHKNHTLEISQTPYIREVLEKFNMTDCKGRDTPSEPSDPFTPEDGDVTEEEAK